MGVGVVNKNAFRGLDVWGHHAVSPFTYVGPNPYPTGGDPVATAAFKLGVVEVVDIGPGVSVDTTTAVVFVYNRTTNKMQAYWAPAGATAAFAEVSNGTDLSGYTAVGIAFGKG